MRENLEDGPETSEYIKSLGCAEVNLRHLYAEGEPRAKVYQAVSDAIVEAASGGAQARRPPRPDAREVSDS